jgi:glycosyltransferase involved in cell wall biosynthesis
MEVAIIIPTKNEEKNLPRLLESLKKQDLMEFKVIVADANSSDRTRDIARRWKGIIVKGGRPAVARDNGARRAIRMGAKILIFIDSDVIIPRKDFLKKSIDEFVERKLDVAGVGITPYVLGKDKRPSRSKDPRLFLFYEIYNIILRLSQKGKSPFMQNYMMSKSEVHKKIGGFGNLEFGEDSAYSKKAARMGYKFRVLNKPGNVFISPRRFKEKGFFRLVALYLYLNARIILGHEFPIEKKSAYFER